MRRLPTVVLGFLFALSGCSSGPGRAQRELPSDWHAVPVADVNGSTGRVERVSDEAKLAPPPSDAVVTGPMAMTNAYDGTWIPLERWSRENGVGTLRALSAGPQPSFALTTTSGVFVVQTRSQSARWDGMEIRLGFEPQLIDGRPFLHVLDVRKNLEPLLRPLVLPERGRRSVVIDPGHGGGNTGTRSVIDGANEKEFTLDWALRLQPLLEANGWQVHLTRTDDSEVPLPDRVAMAEERRADLFISLHFNSAAPGREQAGVETFCLTPVGMPSTLTREFEDDPTRVFPNNAFDLQNLQYAVRLHRELLAVSGIDRGIRRARFLGALRGHNRPAVLLEAGYLSNPDEARRVADPAYRQKLAEAVARALTGDASPPAGGEMRPENSL